MYTLVFFYNVLFLFKKYHSSCFLPSDQSSVKVSRRSRRSRDSLLDDEIMQELHSDRLSDVPSDCEGDKNSNDDDEVDDLDPQLHRKAEKGRG
jgi:hypothetical protein